MKLNASKPGQSAGSTKQTVGASLHSTASFVPVAEAPNFVANQVFRLAVFDHLPRKQASRDIDSIEGDRIIHSATINFGLLLRKGVIQSDDNRVHGLLAVFKCVIQDYKTPPMKILREDLDRFISKQVQYLVDCRPLSKGMGNVVKYIKHSITKISPECSENESKTVLIGKLQKFSEEKLSFAGDSIARNVTSIIDEHDVVFTFGSSPLIRKVLLYAAKSKNFRLIVADTRPLNEGLHTLSALSSKIQCIYVPLSGAAVALKEATKVIVGASCLLSNGSMLASAGTAMIAALAKAKQIPFIVASESYKFSEKVQLDSIVFNEVGHASEIIVPLLGDEIIARDGQRNSNENNSWKFGPQLESGYRGSADRLAGSDSNPNSIHAPDIFHPVEGSDLIIVPRLESRSQSRLNTKLPYEVVNLRYDLTPLNNISLVVTETGLIPPTSVPVLIREMQNETVSM